MPAVALARALQRAGHEPSLLTEGRAVERELLDRCEGEQDLPKAQLTVGRSGVGLPLRLAQATLQARRFFREHGIDLVVGAGGRTCVPAAVAARSLGLPVCLLEQNVVVGRANRMLAPLAQRIYHGLPPQDGTHSKGVLTGTPLREDLRPKEQAACRRALGLQVHEPVLMVTGGSQGAAVLNDVVPRALRQLDRPLQVLHLSGAGRDETLRAVYTNLPKVRALVRPVAMDMATLYGAADLVVCRGGGGTVAELMVAGRAAIIVPYPHHKDRQQWHNGRVLEQAGAALLCEEKDFDVDWLTQELDRLLDQPERLTQMSERARALRAEDPCDLILADLRRLGVLD